MPDTINSTGSGKWLRAISKIPKDTQLWIFNVDDLYGNNKMCLKMIYSWTNTKGYFHLRQNLLVGLLIEQKQISHEIKSYSYIAIQCMLHVWFDFCRLYFLNPSIIELLWTELNTTFPHIILLTFTVNPKKYSHCLQFTVFLVVIRYRPIIPMVFRITSLALGQS